MALTVLMAERNKFVVLFSYGDLFLYVFSIFYCECASG